MNDFKIFTSLHSTKIVFFNYVFKIVKIILNPNCIKITICVKVQLVKLFNESYYFTSFISLNHFTTVLKC